MKTNTYLIILSIMASTTFLMNFAVWEKPITLPEMIGIFIGSLFFALLIIVPLFTIIEGFAWIKKKAKKR